MLARLLPCASANSKARAMVFSRLFGQCWQSPRCCCSALHIPTLLKGKSPLTSGQPQVGASRHPKNREWIRPPSPDDRWSPVAHAPGHGGGLRHRLCRHYAELGLPARRQVVLHIRRDHSEFAFSRRDPLLHHVLASQPRSSGSSPNVGGYLRILCLQRDSWRDAHRNFGKSAIVFPIILLSLALLSCFWDANARAEAGLP
jgi:hypothetical protein